MPDAKSAAAAAAVAEAQAAAAAAAAAKAQAAAAKARAEAEAAAKAEGGTRPGSAGSGGGCFGAVSTVLVVGAAGETTTTAVADVRAGDTVVCADGTATVKVVVEIARDASQPPLRRLPGGLHITARHPVRVNGVWTSPAALSNTSAAEVVDKVFNFVLDSSHVMLVNGVECVTWSHGFVEKTIRHPFYGTDAVLKSMVSTDPAGFASGYVRLAGCLRARKTGEVVGMLGEQHAEAVATAAAC